MTAWLAFGLGVVGGLVVAFALYVADEILDFLGSLKR